jgi:hypothetical protein
MLSQVRSVLFPKTAVEDVMGYITSVLIRYERIGKYHHYSVLFFCKDMDKTMNLILFC